MKAQGRKYLWLIICSALICLMAKGFVFAQDKPPTHPPITDQIELQTVRPVTDKPPTLPPQKVNNEITGQPITDKPPTNPPPTNNQNNQASLGNGADAYPPTPPPVEKPKPVFGGPVNDKLPDPPTGTPDKKSRGTKNIYANIPSPAGGIKDEVIQVDATKKQDASSRDATMPTKTISESPNEPVGMKKETEKITSHSGVSGKKMQINTIDKPLPTRSLNKQDAIGKEIPTGSISKEPEK